MIVSISCLRSPTGRNDLVGLLLQPDSIRHRRCPPAGSRIAATTGTNNLATTARNMFEALPEPEPLYLAHKLRLLPHQRGDIPRPKSQFLQPGIRPPGSPPPSAATHTTMYLTPLAPPTGGACQHPKPTGLAPEWGPGDPHPGPVCLG
ncbi:hypothetical protein ILYODFUR_035492 [Ilyodon furcidens]|uniref:Uncharacterized protein n=1 Tax=Ilyodon furcidens TaxID=33524 RepID=A0ABV0VJR8_9TELE